MNIYLSRHGESIYNTQNKIGGDSELSEKGHEYAKQIANYFNKFHLSLNVWTSTLVRTIETAKHLKYQKFQFPQLDDINTGIFNHLTFEEVKTAYPDICKMRNKHKLTYRYPTGESYQDLIKRVKPLVRNLLLSNKPILIIAHLAILRVLYGLLLKKPLEEIPYISIPLHFYSNNMIFFKCSN